MKNNKVFCRDCIYHDKGEIWCGFYKKLSYVTGLFHFDTNNMLLCSIQNESGLCSNFVRKWWKFWVPK